MGGVTNTVQKLFKKPEVQASVAPAPAPTAPAAKTVSTAMDEEIAARRRARRGARALLSEQRLTPEQGIGSTTLGAGPMQ